jgi:hypothetical protein
MNLSNKNNKTEQKKKNNFSAKKSLIEIEEVGLDPIPVKKNLNMNLNLKKEYIGRKRDLNTKSDKFEKNEKSNDKNDSNKILFCFNCSWKFPERMSLIRRNIHINKCYEGNGKLDIMKYTEEQKLKLYRNYPNKKIINLKVCPICGKEMSLSNLKSKQCHLSTCIKSSLNFQ